MKKIYLLLAFPFIFSSCVSLEEEPESNQVSTQFYNNESDANAAVLAVYSALINGNDTKTLYNRGIQNAPEVATDDYIGGPLASDVNTQAYAALTHDPANSRSQALWEDSYNLINKANIAIDNIEKISKESISETKRAQYINEAKFLRALIYFNLVRWFKYIPLILHETTTLSSESLNVSQASEDEVYNQIIQDLKDAESLPSPVQQSSIDYGRATAGSAKAILAKVYLTRQQWQLAADKAKEIIDSNWYELFNDFEDIFRTEKKNGIEHIFSIQFKGNSGLVSHHMARSAAPLSSMVPGVGGSYADAYNPKSDLYESYAPTDKRRDISLAKTFVSPTNGKSYDLSEPVFNKYYDPSVPGSQINSSVNIPVIRYAEILLIYAEALNELNGPTITAYEYLDKVRERAGINLLKDSYPNLSKDNFRDSVFQERRKEFVFEFNRWFDLSRRGADYYVATLKKSGKLNVQPKHIHLPIPQRELDINPNLKQNPDWVN